MNNRALGAFTGAVTGVLGWYWLQRLQEKTPKDKITKKEEEKKK